MFPKVSPNHLGCVRVHEHASDPRHTTIGDEQPLAFDLVTRDRVLALSRNQPIDEGLAQVRLHMRVLGGVNQYHGILVEQPLVALNEDFKFATFLNESQVPRSAST